MPFRLKINVALREQICEKIGSERVKELLHCHCDTNNNEYHNGDSLTHRNSDQTRCHRRLSVCLANGSCHEFLHN